ATFAGNVLVGVTLQQTTSKLTSRQNGSSIEFGHLNQTAGFYGTLGAQSSSGNPFISFSCNNNTADSFITNGVKGNVISSDTSGNLLFSQAITATSSGQSLTERMRIDSSGNVGIGTSSIGADDGRLKISSPSGNSGVAGISLYGNNGGAFGGSNVVRSKIESKTDGTAFGANMLFYTNDTSNVYQEKMRIDSSGDVLIAKNSTNFSTVGITLLANGEITAVRSSGQTMALNRRGSDGEIVKFYKSDTQVGNISVTGAATAYNTSSDYRLKEDLKDFNGLEMVSSIPVYDHKWKVDDSRSYGVMAHELQEVLPQAVSGEKDAEEMQSVDYSKIVPVLLKAIQELTAKVETLEANACKCKN
ncbi:MAG: tail fiber domain-containing protein, partial [Wenyingzhuangia sp.]|uniref:tail fiber domain-containing protein n=1 Tax=Wenyingzhuangia sp. TaxID=1964193 RepID=UPI003219DD62